MRSFVGPFAGAKTTGPQIMLQPIGGMVSEGGTFTLSAGATGVGVTYQWTFNGVPIAGATQATFVLTAVTQASKAATP